jgi:hypothetical protein
LKLLPHERAGQEVIDAARTWGLMKIGTFFMDRYSRELFEAVLKFKTLYAAYLEDLPQPTSSDGGEH